MRNNYTKFELHNCSSYEEHQLSAFNVFVIGRVIKVDFVSLIIYKG